MFHAIIIQHIQCFWVYIVFTHCPAIGPHRCLVKPLQALPNPLVPSDL